MAAYFYTSAFPGQVKRQSLRRRVPTLMWESPVGVVPLRPTCTQRKAELALTRLTQRSVLPVSLPTRLKAWLLLIQTLPEITGSSGLDRSPAPTTFRTRQESEFAATVLCILLTFQSSRFKYNLPHSSQTLSSLGRRSYIQPQQSNLNHHFYHLRAPAVKWTHLTKGPVPDCTTAHIRTRERGTRRALTLWLCEMEPLSDAGRRVNRTFCFISETACASIIISK